MAVELINSENNSNTDKDKNFSNLEAEIAELEELIAKQRSVITLNFKNRALKVLKTYF